MKLGVLVDENFVKSLNELNKEKLPADLAHRVSVVMVKAVEQQKEYFVKRAALIETYAQKDEAGKVKVVEAEGKQLIDFGDNAEPFKQELAALNETEVEFEKICTAKELAESGVKMSGFQFNSLSPVLT